MKNMHKFVLYKTFHMFMQSRCCQENNDLKCSKYKKASKTLIGWVSFKELSTEWCNNKYSAMMYLGTQFFGIIQAST